MLWIARPATAKKLVEAGCMSAEDLKSPRFSSMLTAKQLAKIKYAGLSAPVQRQDAQDVLVIVEHLLSYCI